MYVNMGLEFTPQKHSHFCSPLLAPRCNFIPHHHFKARVKSLMSNQCNGCLRDAVVVVVGRRCVREDRNEAAFCGAAGTRRRSRGRRHLDVSCDGHAAALLGKEAGPIGVQVLVKLIAVHLTQKLCLTQLVESLQVTLCFWRGGQLTQVAVVEAVVDLVER